MTLRLGILGAAKIAGVFCRHLAADPLPASRLRIVAVASRRADTAAAFADEHGIARWHASYEALLADDEVDAVYIPLPNTLHAPWAVHAAEAGKHVLCEKPLTTSLAEAEAMFAAARKSGVMLLEGYPWWFQPQTADMVSLLEAGAVGRVQSVHASFCFKMAQPQGNIRMNPDLGGGALLDAGSYPLSFIQLVMGERPLRVRADASWTEGGPERGVDMSMSGTLFYADGRRALLSCAMDIATHRRATIFGDAGVIETEFLNHTSQQPAGDAGGHLPSQMRVRRGIANSVPLEEVRSPTGSGFRFAAEAFARVVAERDFDAIERAAAASLDIAATLEALALSARQQRDVDVRRA